MLRVTPIQTESMTTLKLEGNLSGPWVDELRQCWTKLVEDHIPLEIDLRGLSFLDPDGTTLLLHMEREGTRLFGSSAFIHDLLHIEALVRTTRPRRSFKREN
jgi:ABC-type transporter Mla MlaB component